LVQLTKAGALLFAALLLIVSGSARAVGIELITATDPSASFTLVTGVITSGTTGPAQDAVVLSGGSFPAGSTLHVEMELSVDSGFTVGSVFVGTPDATPDLYILDAIGTPLITADLNSIDVTGLASGPAGSALTSVTLGSLDGASSDLVLTGGTLASSFGGVGAVAELSVLLNNPTDEFGFFSTFDVDWTAQMNVQLQFHTVPEPGTFTLLALPLGMAMLRRTRRKS